MTNVATTITAITSTVGGGAKVSAYSRRDTPPWSTYRGDPPTTPPAPVLGPSPVVHLAHSDPFARARIAAVQSRVAAPVLSDPRLPPPVPVFSPFRDGHYWCSKCPRRGFTTIPGLMRHVTHQHAGSSVDEATCSLFAAIERVTCTAPSCGGLRRMGARICNRCGQTSQARPPRVGDVIMGPLGAPSSSEDVVMADAEASATPSLTVDLPLVDLPTGFTQRIRALPSSTILHVPASCRLRMISVVAQCWNGMAQGRDDYAQLEEGRSKLLLSTVPQGLSVASEVQKRLTLWEERSFETLLQRAEEQFLLKRKAGKRRKTGGLPDPSERGNRARRTAAVGAYRKATAGLVSSMLSFSEQEDTRWAQELLPTSELGSAAHCDPQLAPPSCFARVHLGQAFLWFALCRSHCSWPDWNTPRAHYRSAQCSAQDSCQQDPRCAFRAVLQDLRWLSAPCRQMAHSDTALLATQEEWQAASHQDG